LVTTIGIGQLAGAMALGYTGGDRRAYLIWMPIATIVVGLLSRPRPQVHQRASDRQLDDAGEDSVGMHGPDAPRPATREAALSGVGIAAALLGGILGRGWIVAVGLVAVVAALVARVASARAQR
jgi:hypothetical protein